MKIRNIILVLASLLVAGNVFAGSYHIEGVSAQGRPTLATYYLGDSGNRVDSIQVDSIDTPYIRLGLGGMTGFNEDAIVRVQVIKPSTKDPKVNIAYYAYNRNASEAVLVEQFLVADSAAAGTTAAILETLKLSEGGCQYAELRFRGFDTNPSGTYVKFQVTVKKTEAR